jgi:ribulose-phosphate 3-epimerase
VDHAQRVARFEAAALPVVTPSLLDCDFSCVGEELAALERAGAAAVHLDVMDGHFVPNLSYGPPVIRDWRPRTNLFFDAHLMISDPARYAEAFVQAGCDAIIVHIEVLVDPVPLLRHIRSLGCQAALSLNPPTPMRSIAPYLTEVDKVLVMSVMPGFGGQAFEPEVLGKVREIRRLRPTLPIAIDGGIKAGNAAEVVAAGVTQLVVGSAIFRPDGDYAAALREIQHAGSFGRGPESSGSPAPE